MKKHSTRRIIVGSVPVGGGAPVSVQSMTKTDTRDVEATCAQIAELSRTGCEIVRVAVPDQVAARALKSICARSPIPVIADVHFDHRLALAAVAAGVDGLRINPGNIGSELKVKEVVSCCRERNIPIRVGVNEGSLSQEMEARYGGPTPRALVESALQEVGVIEKMGYEEIKISVKAFDVFTSREAYRLLSRRTDYPLHIGITEAGPPVPGTVRSAIGISMLLLEGIGDTIRVSLSTSPLEEVRVGREILQTLGLRSYGPVIISCPTCGRTQVDLLALVREVEKKVGSLSRPEELAGVRVAVMGCEVNGPGEARHAEIGIAGGKETALLFKGGKVLQRLPVSEAADALMAELLTLRTDHI
ncbi:MAG: flavodoxin-dependent (E)-4-hydroxy-3-methylbut-2-enyl-diphosphate synthase [Candidatus Euphemobacter frigidus]|nr:flavodoxin-dependent (E)-4-hydroxy-3-methylbut-2-enyl-diphosphate synthase [Candidatus Euphemobacter frigidus]MDP8274917.1 flavodoxin-dependent (E)-4-hydroxy-3-methylbut-2-enyl-diphosphate synthase [Candidatus Euphemobacter frigidus]